MWGCRNYRHSPMFCHRCDASKVAERGWHFHNFDSPTWTPVSNDSFKQGPGRVRNPLTPLVHVDMVRPWYLHTFHLGWGRLINGATIYELALEQHFGAGSLSEQLAAASLRLKEWARANRVACNQPKFTAARINVLKKKDAAELKGKGWNSRVVTAWLADELQTRVGPPSDHGDLRTAVVWSLAQLYCQLERAPQLLTAQQADKAYESGVTAPKCYKLLSARAAGPHWPLRPKAHWVHHSLEDMRAWRVDLTL